MAMLNNQMVHLSTQLGFHTNQTRFFSGKWDPAQNWDICRKNTCFANQLRGCSATRLNISPRGVNPPLGEITFEGLNHLMDMLVVVSCSIPEKHGCVADMGTRAHLQTGRGDQSVYNWGIQVGKTKAINMAMD